MAVTFAMLQPSYLNAQMNDDDILKYVGNTKMYETLQIASMDRDLSTFVNLVQLSGLGTSMMSDTEHTLLIPTNDAFRKMDIKNFAHITNPNNRADLIKFLQYHVLPNKIASNRFADDQVIEVGDMNEDIPVNVENGVVLIGGAQVLKADIEALNGIIHVIDNVIAPAYDDVFKE